MYQLFEMSDDQQKRRKKAQGLHPTSVAHVMKKGSGVDRVSEKAVMTMVDITERSIRNLAKAACKHLEISKKKTVDNKVLLSCIESMSCTFWDPVVLDQGITSKERTKGDRRKIASESCKRVFSKGCPLGKGQHQMAEKTKDALSLLVESYIKNFSDAAAEITRNGKRKTLSSSDIATAQKVKAHK